MVSSRQIVDAPSFTPSPYGLLSVVQQPSGGDAHWQNGITYQTRCLVSGDTTYDECIAVTGDAAPPEPPVKTDNVDLVDRAATAFTVYARFDCSPVGVVNAAATARDAMSQSAPWQVERAFWTGVAGGQSVVFPHLAADAEESDADGVLLQTAAEVPTTGTAEPMNIACGLGWLEQELADCYAGVGVIHVARKVLPTLMAARLVEPDGDRLVTPNGNLVAVGSGYPGTSPAGSPTEDICHSWIYATGAVFAYSGPVRVLETRETMDRASNTNQMLAEQTYVLGWDCCHAAVPVILGV